MVVSTAHRSNQLRDLWAEEIDHMFNRALDAAVAELAGRGMTGSGQEKVTRSGLEKQRKVVETLLEAAHEEASRTDSLMPLLQFRSCIPESWHLVPLMLPLVSSIHQLRQAVRTRTL